MYNYPFYANPSYYSTGMGSGILGGSGAGGLLKGITSKFSWNGFLTSTGKTLNVINQAIPIFYQVRPIVKNARTMFRVLGAVKGLPNEESTANQTVSRQTQTTFTKAPVQQETSNSPTVLEEGKPTFFL